MNKEAGHKALHYADDLGFVKWVKSGFVFNNDYWSQKKGMPSENEAIEEAIDLVSILGFESFHIGKERKTNLFQRIENTIDTSIIKAQKKEPISRRLILSISVAASLLLLIGVFWPSNSKNQIITALAEIQNIKLPDESEVVLNAESQLSFSNKNYTSNRVINLEGEAFFNVEKGQKFVVQTKLGNVEVLGTSFNVFSRKDHFEVICKTGKVSVKNAEGSSQVILMPGESCVLQENKIVKEKSTISGDEWIDGIFHFKDARLSEVIEELNRQFNITISYPKEIGIDPYSGFFNSKNLDEALQSVFWPLNFSYEKKSNEVIEIKSK